MRCTASSISGCGLSTRPTLSSEVWTSTILLRFWRMQVCRPPGRLSRSAGTKPSLLSMNWGGDVVVKPLFGSEGRGMVRVSDEDTVYRVLRALELGRYVYCMQEFTPHGREDIRVFVVGTSVVGAMVRRGVGWKTNAAQGAKSRACHVNNQIRDLSVRAALAVGAEHAGVDILPREEGGYTVLEVNTIPGWRSLLSATGVDAAERLVDHVLEESG